MESKAEVLAALLPRRIAKRDSRDILLLLSLLIRFVTPVDCVLCATIRLEISVRVQLDLSERHFRSDSGAALDG